MEGDQGGGRCGSEVPDLWSVCDGSPEEIRAGRKRNSPGWESPQAL